MNGDVDRDGELEGIADVDGVRSALPPHPAGEYAFRVVEYPDRPDECTICPRSIEKEELLTTWITARRSASVDLGANR